MSAQLEPEGLVQKLDRKLPLRLGPLFLIKIPELPENSDTFVVMEGAPLTPDQRRRQAALFYLDYQRNGGAPIKPLDRLLKRLEHSGQLEDIRSEFEASMKDHPR